MLPMYGEHCLSRQAVHNWEQKFSEGRTSIEDEHRVGRLVEIATPTCSASKTSSEQTETTRILHRRFPGTCETVGQVFKFVWRLRWKINVVCMSLSSFVSFQSRFVTCLLTFRHILLFLNRNKSLFYVKFKIHRTTNLSEKLGLSNLGTNTGSNRLRTAGWEIYLKGKESCRKMGKTT